MSCMILFTISLLVIYIGCTSFAIITNICIILF